MSKLTAPATPFVPTRLLDSEPATRRSAELEACWTERDFDVTTARVDRKGTVRSARDAPLPEVSQPLPTLHISGRGEGAEFELGEVLGMGGMGVVQAATQTSLSRAVAIKALRPEVKNSAATPQLLLEARVIGTLDHPNVVPIHAIGQDGQGRPLIVMKRIEGRSWEQTIAELGRVNDEDGKVLQRHLTTLVQVARAVHFAHSRGILHRDIKPANVMIGEFGEVYLVDWGIAVALDARAPAGLPPAREVASLYGTPAYMSPEMAAADGSSLSEQSDVYLLGATLHELLTGHAPHEAATLLEMVRLAFLSAPYDYGPEIPAGLAEICHKAMSWDPLDRHADAGAFADAIEAYLHHQGSTILSDEAITRLGQLRAELGRVAVEDPEQLRAARALFSEIRFAFAMARRSWPGNHRATEGLQEALELMIEFELGAGAPEVAAARIPELPEPRPELSRRVDRAVRIQREKRQRLERIARDADLTIGERQRKVLTLLVASVWCVCCVATGLLRRYQIHEVSQVEFGILCAGFVVGSGLTVWVRRRTLYANVATRRLAHIVVLVFGIYTVLWLVAEGMGLSANSTATLTILLGGALWLAMTVLAQRRWGGMAGGHGAALVASLIWREYGFEFMGIGGLLGAGVTAWYHHRASQERSAPPESVRG